MSGTNTTLKKGAGTAGDGKAAAAKKRKKTTTVVSKKTKKKAPAPSVVSSAKAESKEKEASSHVIKSSGNTAAYAEQGRDGNSSSEGEDSDDEEEGEDGYRVGGYHPVSIGDKFSSRYVVIEKLGWGHFSTVWRCYDTQRSSAATPAYVAMKIQKAALHYREAALDEIELLHCVRAAQQTPEALAEFGPSYDPCVVTLQDSFQHLGKHGNHVCMTFEILGDNLLRVIKKYNYRGIPVPIVRGFVRQICTGLDFLHRHCQIIHTDLKPENVLIVSRSSAPDLSYVRGIVGDKAGASAVTGTGAKGKGKKGKTAS
ncbi:kinase-like domain-containing protein, partial [Ochromonadaceae sp. CCMP2298]